MVQTYDTILRDQLQQGFIELTSDTNGTTHYIPYHSIKKDLTTTPIRIIYDCSCHGSADQPSLNDCLMTGPLFLNDLVSIILPPVWHLNRYKKAFLHIIIHEKDHDFMRFLWLSDATNLNSEFAIYCFRTVLFGSVAPHSWHSLP